MNAGHPSKSIAILAPVQKNFWMDGYVDSRQNSPVEKQPMKQLGLDDFVGFIEVKFLTYNQEQTAHPLQSFSSWWFFTTHLKNMLVKMGIFTK